MKPDAQPLDPFHAHEVIDRSHVICCMIDDFLLDHPYVVAHPDIKAKIEKGQMLLADAYQELSRVADTEFPDPTDIAP